MKRIEKNWIWKWHHLFVVESTNKRNSIDFCNCIAVPTLIGWNHFSRRTPSHSYHFAIFSTWALLITVYICNCKCEPFINYIVKKDLWKYKYSYWIYINPIVTTIDFFFENWAKPAKPNFSLGFFFISIVYSLEVLPVTDPPFCT